MDDARTVLHLLIRRRGLTFATFARLYERTARELARREREPQLIRATVSEQTFRRWTSGKVRGLPNPPAPQILEAMFQRPAAELLAPAGAHTESESPGTAGSAQLTPVIQESELVMTAHNASGHAFEAAAQQLPDLSIDQLADDLRALARSYAHTPVSESWRGASRALKTAQTMLDRTQKTRQRTALYLHAATASALMSSAAFDLGSLPTAAQLARTCALYGQIIDHHPSQAYAAGQLACIAYWDGRPAEAVRHADEAATYTDIGDSGRLRIAVISARAHAHHGDATKAAAQLAAVPVAEAGERTTRDDLHDDVGGEFSMPTMRALMSNATTHLLLQDAVPASEAARQALASGLLPPAQAANAATDLARALLLSDDLDAAAEPAATALSLEPSLCTAAVADRLTALRRDLAQPRVRDSSQARELGERIEYYTATAAPAVIFGTPPALDGPQS